MTAPTTSATPKIALDRRASSRHDKAQASRNAQVKRGYVLLGRFEPAQLHRQEEPVVLVHLAVERQHQLGALAAQLPPLGQGQPSPRPTRCPRSEPPGATKNGTSMQRGPDCLSGSLATAEMPASTRLSVERLGQNGPRCHYFHP